MGTGGGGAAFGTGGFEPQFVIVFETFVDLARVVENVCDASAGCGAMHGDDRPTTEVHFTKGRSFFVPRKTGWRVDARGADTNSWKDTELNQ